MDSLIKYVTVTAIPSKPNKPIGESTLSQNPGNKNYTTNKVSGATKYTWSISPSNAGTTISTDTSATIVWSSTYTGAVKIKVLAENSCGQGKNSDSLMVTISPITSVENLQEIVAPKIYPNPSSGLIFIETFTPLNLEIYDLLGKLVFASVLNNSSNLILNNGVYIVKTNSKGKIFTQKVIVSSNK